MLVDPDIAYRIIATRDARHDGQLFVGVRTTGIFCRPICPARTPRRAHVEFFASAAAAAQGGYRPCLRCRPERAPAPGLRDVAHATVERALALLVANAYSKPALMTLAPRLGLADATLRGLFSARFGATPRQIARTQRLLFARQLLHETAMSATAAARAAGFTDAAGLRKAYHEVCHHDLTQSRRRLRASAWTILELAYRPPLAWDFFLEFHRARAIDGVERVSADAYRRVITLGNDCGLIDLRRGRGHSLRLAIRFPRPAAFGQIVQRVRCAFDLDANPTVIEAHLSRDPALAPLVAARPGLRIAGSIDPFEQGVRAILGQQISVSAAIKLAARLAARWGTPVEFDDEPALRVAFPTPRQLADADVASLGMPAARGAAVASFARAVQQEPELLERGATLAQSLARLRALPGIGDWSAQYIAMRALREPDAFPAGDVALLRALAADGSRPRPAELFAQADRWQPWRAYAAQHLWAKDSSVAMAAKLPA